MADSTFDTHRLEQEARAHKTVDDAWRILAETPVVANKLGRTLHRLPDIGPEVMASRASEGRNIIARIDLLDTTVLSPDLYSTVASARTTAESWVNAEKWYWLVFDPLGDGFFSMFAPSAYSGGFVLDIVHEALANTSFVDRDGADEHLRLIGQYARIVRQITERTRGQAGRGIYMPSPQRLRSCALVAGLKERAFSSLHGISADSAGISPTVSDVVHSRILTEVGPAFDELLELLDSTDYATNAPESVGLCSYPGGAEIYDELVTQHTTQTLSAVEVHRRGHERMARIEDEMRELMTTVGFEGSPITYLNSIGEDPRWRASTDEEVEMHFQRYIDRFDSEVGNAFGVLPSAEYGVAPMHAAASGSMTFGYYSPPHPARTSGLYFFNGSHLRDTALPMIAALNYHELVPGHHLHLAIQSETTNLHPIRQYSGTTAFTEGWAEYAARFAGEVGMYREPEELFGRLMMEAFLTSRLVVDTGMNALGWSLERGRDYMREHSFLGEEEIASETLRYSCDIPGQALAYKLGDDFLYALREELRADLGAGFDITDFHDAVLRAAGLPLPLLSKQVRSDLLS